jgi:hypothetical protein
MGKRGLARSRSQRVDCVVLALELPDRSGCQILVELFPMCSLLTAHVMKWFKALSLRLNRDRTRLPSATCGRAIEQPGFENFVLMFLRGDHGKVLFDAIRRHELDQRLVT